MQLPVQFLRQRRDIAARAPLPNQGPTLQQKEDFCNDCAIHPDDENCHKFQQGCAQLSASLAAATSSSPPGASSTSGAQASGSGSALSTASPASPSSTNTDSASSPGDTSSTFAGSTTASATQSNTTPTTVESLSVVPFSETFGLQTTPSPLSVTPTSSSPDTTTSSTKPAMSVAQDRLSSAHSVSTGAIVGIIVGVVALVLALGAVLMLRRRRRLRQIAPSQEFMWRTTSAPGSVKRSPSRQNLSLNLGTEPDMAAVGGGMASRSASPYAQSQTRSYESPTAGPGLGPPPLHAVGFGESQYGDAYRSNSPYGGYDGLNPYVQSQPADSNPYIDPPGSNNPYIDRSRSNNPYLDPSASATNPFANPTSNPFASPYGTPAGSREHLRRPTLDSELL